MVNKKLVIVIIVIMFLSIGGFIGVNFFLDNSNNDEVMEKIRGSYSMVEEDIVTYNKVRDDLILVMKDYYSDNLENDYDNFLNNLKDIDEILSVTILFSPFIFISIVLFILLELSNISISICPL